MSSQRISDLSRLSLSRTLTEIEQFEYNQLMELVSNSSESGDAHSNDDRDTVDAPVTRPRHWPLMPVDSSNGSGDDADDSDFEGGLSVPLMDLAALDKAQEALAVVMLDANIRQEPEAVEPNRGRQYIGQGKNDNTEWWSNPSPEEYKRTVSLAKERKASLPVVTPFADKMSAFKSVLDDVIVRTICIETNRRGKRAVEANERLPLSEQKRMRPWYPMTENELYAFIGLVLYAGAEKSNLVEAKDLFAKGHTAIYRATMSLDRFEQITRFLRFDDHLARPRLLASDKLASFRYVWTVFLNNLIRHYFPSSELCIDEQLLNTRNRCPIRQYIPSKPGKYGIKINWIVDAETSYPLFGEVYVGQQPNDERSTGLAHQLVLRLAEKWLDSNRNITMDNYFTSYPLACELWERRSTTIVGTLRSNKREIPKEFAGVTEAVKRGKFKSVFCFSKHVQLTGYTTNKMKNVLLLSTAHATEERDMSTHAEKPRVILDYNRFKGGVDSFDQMVRGYTSKRKSCRWPVALFYNCLDVGALAAFRLFEMSNNQWHPRTADKRKTFLKELASDLVKAHLIDRSKKPLKPSTLNAMSLIDFIPPAATPKIRFPVPLGSIVSI